MTLPPPMSPGWYPDRGQGGRQRYWDGARWSEHRPTQPADPPAPEPSPQEQDDEPHPTRKRLPVVSILAVTGLLAVIGAVVILVLTVVWLLLPSRERGPTYNPGPYTVTATGPVGDTAAGVAVDPRTHTVYVATGSEPGTVSEIDG